MLSPRLLTSLALCAAFLAGCSSAAPRPGLQGAESTVSALALAFSACDFQRVESLYAPTAEFQAPDTPKPVIGRAAVMKHLAGACTAAYRPVMKVLDQRSYALGPEGAVVSGTYTIGRTDRPNDAPWSASFVITLVNSSGTWLIQSQATFLSAR